MAMTHRAPTTLLLLPLLAVFLAGASRPEEAKAPAHGGELSGDQLRHMEKDGFLLFSEELPGKPWPRLTFFRLISARPEEAFAVFADVESESTYIPGIMESRISRRLDASTLEVRYVQDMPWPVQNETMTILNWKERRGTALTVNWKLLSATSARAASGFASFEPWSNITLMIYQTWVDPGYDIAKWPLVRKVAARRTGEVTRLFEQQVYKVKTQRPMDLARLQVESLQAIGRP